MPINLEVPIFGPGSARAAVAAGAARIELNASGSYPAGGLTPTILDLAQLQDLNVPVRVMIRVPSSLAADRSDFIYRDEELDAMEASMEQFKRSRFLDLERGDGFVFGAVRETGAEGVVDVDSGVGRRFVEAAKPYKIVFHRAFDAVIGVGGGDEELSRGKAWLRELVQLGFDGVLTSGGPGNAAGNSETLKAIVANAGDDIEIIVGGGVRSGNVGKLVDTISLRNDGKASWVHSSCLLGDGSEEVDVGELQNILAQVR